MSNKTKEERYEELLSKLKKNPREFKGFVAAAEEEARRLVHWKNATTDRDGSLKSNPEQVQFDFTPPPIVKRDPLARVESLTKRLLDHMEETYIAYGTPQIPEELLDEIKREYALNGKINEAADVTVENIKALCAAYLQAAERGEGQGRQ